MIFVSRFYFEPFFFSSLHSHHLFLHAHLCVRVSVRVLQDAMLREYQDEIKRLKDQLDATQRGVIIGEDGKVQNGKELVIF